MKTSEHENIIEENLGNCLYRTCSFDKNSFIDTQNFML